MVGTIDILDGNNTKTTKFYRQTCIASMVVLLMGTPHVRKNNNFRIISTQLRILP